MKYKILCIIPPYIPSYFNAGHHLPLFSVAAFLRSRYSESDIICIDAGALNYTWKDIADILIKGFDFIVMMNDFDAVDDFDRFIRYSRKLSPKSKLVTFGRLSKQAPKAFRKFKLDGIVVEGDYETGVDEFISYYSFGKNAPVFGVDIRINDTYIDATSGKWLSVNEWKLPNINEIPYFAYDKMYKRDFNKFCGIPDRRELVIPIARGCPVGCSYCDVPTMQGKTERRITVDSVIEYIISSFSNDLFEYYSFYCPTFTLNKKWVLEYCNKTIEKGIIYPWKCVTVVSTLDEDMIKLMAQSGCIRISVGLETLDENASKGLPKIKQNVEKKLIEISNLCIANNIELNCFIILGLPNDSFEGVKYTVEKVLSLGARVRPTIYTPYHNMDNNTTIEDLNYYNRQLFVPGTIDAAVESDYYDLFYNNEKDFETSVMKKIPQRFKI